MAKTRLVYVCRDCGGQSPKWAGQCPDCGAWNSLDESKPVAKVSRLPGYSGEIGLESLAESAAKKELRISTGMKEFDRVLGGGVVQGSVTLIGGDPGIGKSTLLLQMMASLSARLRHSIPPPRTAQRSCRSSERDIDYGRNPVGNGIFSQRAAASRTINCT